MGAKDSENAEGVSELQEQAMEQTKEGKEMTEPLLEDLSGKTYKWNGRIYRVVGRVEGRFGLWWVESDGMWKWPVENSPLRERFQ